MKTLSQLIKEVSDAHLPPGDFNIPDMETLRSIFDAVRKNNPSQLSKAKSWVSQLSALKSKYPGTVKGRDLIDFFELGDKGHDMRSFIDGLKTITNRDVYPSIPVDARNFVNKVDKFVKLYTSMNSPAYGPKPQQPNKDWQPTSYTDQTATDKALAQNSKASDNSFWDNVASGYEQPTTPKKKSFFRK